MVCDPSISVIIVAWNSGKHLAACLDKLSRQTLADFETILVDNGSGDTAGLNIGELSGGFALRVERLRSNLGFAAANNIGARLARGEWIVLLNADAYPESDWLENLSKAARQNPEYNFFSSRQIQYNAPHLLDGAGDEYHVSGLAWRKYYNHPVAKFGLDQVEVFSACAAAAMYRREDFLKVGGFDEDYFSYFEDVDLSFRLRLAGGRCLYVPQAVVHHVGSASTGKGSDFSFYHGHRNLVWTFFKDMPGWLLGLYLPLHMAMNIYLSLAFFVRDRRTVVLKSKVDAFRHLPKILQKRRHIQQMRKARIGDIHRIMSRNLLSPHYAFRQRAQKNNPSP